MTYVPENNAVKPTPRPKGLAFTYAGIGIARLMVIIGVLSIIAGIYFSSDGMFVELYFFSGAFAAFSSAVILGVLCEISFSVAKPESEKGSRR